MTDLLVFHQGALGDFILAFPVLRSLRVCFRRIGAVCRGSFGGLARHLGLIEESFPLEAACFASLYAETPDERARAVMQPYPAVLLFSRSNELERACRSLGRQCVVRIPPWPQDPETRHTTRFLADRILDSPLIPEDRKPAFEKALYAAPLRPRSGRSRRIAMSPGSGGRDKRWPLERFLEAALLLRSRGYSMELVLGPAEGDLEARLRGGLPEGILLRKPPTLIELARLLDSCTGFIGNDSAPGHLAAFLGVPTAVVFGRSDPERWKPFGPSVAVVAAPHGMGEKGLERISAAAVVRRLDRLLEEAAAAGSDSFPQEENMPE
ncbi:MAG: glycosyltransferase family 9 protein [Anaerolineales bacterium]|nr:glycosyltransferase family 9 protein [Anaerolineales bacterium]